MSSPSFEKIYEPLMKLKDICGDTIPQSEIYNETWMLRLVLSLMSKVDTKSNTFTDSQSDSHLRDVCMAVKCGWISEGGLKPIFKQESTTWTDAIVGAVQKSSSNRNIEKNEAAIYKGVIVIEAKMGSDLSAGGSRLKGYNQVARNIACLARFMVEGCENVDIKTIKKCKFLVFAPKAKIGHWRNLDEKQQKKKRDRFYSPDNMIESTSRVLDEIKKKYVVRQELKEKWQKVKTAVEEICKHSIVISWDDVIKFLQNHLKDYAPCLGCLGCLNDFYNQAKELSGINIKEC